MRYLFIYFQPKASDSYFGVQSLNTGSYTEYDDLTPHIQVTYATRLQYIRATLIFGSLKKYTENYTITIEKYTYSDPANYDIGYNPIRNCGSTSHPDIVKSLYSFRTGGAIGVDSNIRPAQANRILNSRDIDAFTFGSNRALGAYIDDIVRINNVRNLRFDIEENLSKTVPIIVEGHYIE